MSRPSVSINKSTRHIHSRYKKDLDAKQKEISEFMKKMNQTLKQKKEENDQINSELTKLFRVYDLNTEIILNA